MKPDRRSALEPNVSYETYCTGPPNSTGLLATGITVFLAQGTSDQIIRPEVTEGYMKQLCRAGSKVKLVILPDIGHGRAAQASTMDVVRWIPDRFAGEPAPSDCPP